MDYAFTSDQQLLKNSARAFLEKRCAPAVVRSVMEDPRGEAEAMWKEMAELGWLGLALPEAAGGSALGMVETAIVLEEMGRVAYPGPYLPTVIAGMALTAFGTAAQQARWLPAIAAGEARATLALLDTQLDWSAEAVATRAEKVPGGIRLSGTKRFVPWAHVANLLLVPAHGPDGMTVYLVDPGPAGVEIVAMTAIDPGARWATVSLNGITVDPHATLGAPGRGTDVLDWLLRRAAVAAAAEMLGAARRCLHMSVDYAKVREQFGQPIGSFQAIRHTCAEMLLAVENAHAATYYAAWALDADAADGPLAASIAKAYVGDAARQVCGDAIQVHGGIGFTWEYDLHLYFKRAKALEAMYGDADHHSVSPRPLRRRR